MECYIVAYAKIIIDKEDGIILQDVYYGGMSHSASEIEVIARECVNTFKGGTIFPRIIKLEEDGLIVDALYDATEKFETIVANMIESDAIVNRGRRHS